jgi:hypothetical protein
MDAYSACKVISCSARDHTKRNFSGNNMLQDLMYKTVATKGHDTGN